MKDPDSFTIPCTIGNSIFEKVLCDMGASIWGGGGVVIEDVLVKVDKFIFPPDFIVLDMEEDKKNTYHTG